MGHRSVLLATVFLACSGAAGAAGASTPDPGADSTPTWNRRSPHFLLASLGGWRSERLEREVLDSLEGRYRRFMILFETEPTLPLVVELYPAAVFHASTGAPTWVDGMFAGDGRIRLAIGGIARLEPPLERLLAHELAHAFIAAASGGRAPRWLHEGLAQYAAGAPAGSRLRVVAESAAALDYAGSLAFVHHMVRRHGGSALVDVLHALRREEEVAAAFLSGTGSELATLFNQWRGSPSQGTAVARPRAEAH